MKEDTLRRFFAGEVSAGELADDLRDAVVVTGRDSSGIRMTPMDNTFRVSSAHLERICGAALENKLPLRRDWFREVDFLISGRVKRGETDQPPHGA
jgi:hypothetical protein